MCCVRNHVEVKREEEVILGVHWSNHMSSLHAVLVEESNPHIGCKYFEHTTGSKEGISSNNRLNIEE